ncbi:hypothetical protein ACFLQ0_06540, partial [Nitrospinota bacterium]
MLGAAGQPNIAGVNLIIEPVSGTDWAKVDFTFVREKAPKRELLIAAINLPGAKGPGNAEAIGDLEIGRLTGWYIGRKELTELWVGKQLDQGILSADMSLKIPGLLVEQESYPRRYKVIFIPVTTDLVEIAHKAEQLTFAQVRNVEVRVPKAFSVVGNWSLMWEFQGDFADHQQYGFELKEGDHSPHVLILEEVPNWISAWLDKKLGT